MDKIFISDFVKDIEIGAYQSERGRTQRVRFNVVLEVGESNTEIQDDVDNVLSYEIILEAINFWLERQRFNLLETLAEKIAETCLQNESVHSASIKIEKLDKIPGTMGVSIFKNKSFHNKSLDSDHILPEEDIDCSLVYFSNSVIKI